MDARVKPGHDAEMWATSYTTKTKSPASLPGFRIFLNR